MAGKFVSQEERFSLFFPVRHGMRLKQESEKMMTVCAKKGKRENDVFFYYVLF